MECSRGIVDATIFEEFLFDPLDLNNKFLALFIGAVEVKDGVAFSGGFA